MYYDLNVRNENLEQTTKLAKELGFSGIGVIVPYSRDFPDKISDLKNKKEGLGIDIALGVEISEGNIKKTARSIRKQVELIFVKGGSHEINREALEAPEVDVLTNPSDNGKSGINHVLAKLAKKNNVSIGIDFQPVLHSFGKTRAQLLSAIFETARFLKKYHAPFIISSGAKSEWDLRSPPELTAFGKFLGFREPEIKQALSDKIVKENRKRLSDKWIMPGVEVE